MFPAERCFVKSGPGPPGPLRVLLNLADGVLGSGFGFCLALRELGVGAVILILSTARCWGSTLPGSSEWEKEEK